MKSFLKMFFASLMAVMLSFWFFGCVMIASFADNFFDSTGQFHFESSDRSNNKEEPTSDYLLHLELEHFIFEKEPLKRKYISLFSKKPLTPALETIRKRLEAITKESPVEGLFLDIKSVQANWPTKEQLRRVLLDFKKRTDKKIYAYISDHASESSLYLASAADHVSIYPFASFEINGLNINVTFFKTLLDKLKLEFYISRVGKFKSAVEPFIRTTLSPENRKQLQDLLDSLWKSYSQDLGVQNLDEISENLSVTTASEALHAKLVHSTLYRSEFLNKIKKENSFKTSLNDMLWPISNKNVLLENSFSQSEKKTKNVIAFIDLSGEIVGRAVKKGETSVEKVLSALREIREDKKHVKALILEIDSPGGDAVASDIMWKEITLLKKELSIPVISRFKSIAASGGYYIGAAADIIFASRYTLTGSIGIFALIPQIENVLGHIGLNSESVMTHSESRPMGITKNFTALQKDKLEKRLNELYTQFKTVVKNSRKFSEDTVIKLATGRV